MTGRPRLSRRRALAICGAAAGLPMWPGTTGAVPTWEWNGDALGAAASIRLCHSRPEAARAAAVACVAELRRLEAEFSLYRSDSALCRLNRDGILPAPSHDMVLLMDEAQRWGARTAGAFDVTVQPLWRCYADHFRRHADDAAGPSARQLEQVRRMVDYRAVDIAKRAIRFAVPGMGVTLNGIAQGYITDRVLQILRDGGIDSALVSMGEIAAFGLDGDGRAWRIALDHGDVARRSIELRDGAVATSAATATRFDAAGRFHHLISPADGRPAGYAAAVSVIARSARAADALSTALFVTPPERMQAILHADPSAHAIVRLMDGRSISLPSYQGEIR